MKENRAKRIWKVRTVKNYPEAHNHIIVGEVLERSNPYVRMQCRTFHFGKNLNGTKDIKSGKLSLRIIPWGRIEVVNELDSGFDLNSLEVVFEESRAYITDGKNRYPLASSYDNRY